MRTSQPDYIWDQGKKISLYVSPCAGLTRFLTVLSASAVNQTASIFSYYWAALPLWLGSGGQFFLFADEGLQISQRHSAKYLKDQRADSSNRGEVTGLLKQLILLIKVQILTWSTYCARLLAAEQNRRSNVWAVHKGDIFTGELQTRPVEHIPCITRNRALIKSAWSVWCHIKP